MSSLSDDPIPNQNKRQKPLLKQAIVICSLASLFYVYEFFLRVTPSAITYQLMHEFHIDAKSLGIMSSLFYYGYSPMQIPAGLLIDRFGPRVLMTISMFICALGALLFTGHTLTLLSIGRFLIGLASSFAFVGALVLASRWFQAKYFALITGLIQFMGCLGAIVGAAPVALLAQTISWRTTLIYMGLIGFALAFLFGVIIRDTPPNQPSKDPILPQTKSQYLQEWHRLYFICKNPQTWIIACCAFACWGPIAAFASLWGVPFLITDYHMSATEASAAISLVWLGIAIASPVIGWWSNVIKSRRTPLICCAALGLLSSLVLIYIHHLPTWFIYILLFFFGSAASAQSITFGLVKDTHPPDIEGTAIGFNNMAVVFGGMTLQPFTGMILRAAWDGKTRYGVPIYSIQAYEKALLLLPLCAVILLIASIFFIKETHCKVQYHLHEN